MEHNEKVNCYCFNPACSRSVFNYNVYSVVKMPLVKAVSEEGRCPECGDELISKPLLEVRSFLNDNNDTIDAAA